ncbi:hypothetical protein NHP164001_16370 [Helicobacter trogontum]|uniref:Glycoside hydrolase family 19 catalytic domain-containing protein n=1 Tax=Helicobacter trogontum TaxID=50960 RepID=A0ABQ0D5I6_9HELI
MRQGDGDNFRERSNAAYRGSNYKDFTTKAKEWGWIDNVADFEAKPDLILQNGKFALLSAVYFWNSKELYKIADTQNENNTNEIVKQITKKVNGGENALSDRQQVFHKIQSSKIFEEFLDKREII